MSLLWVESIHYGRTFVEPEEVSHFENFCLSEDA
jgi:hypothetical protein